MSKSHNPTPEERDERFSLYGLDPEKVIETVLQVKSEPEERSTRARKRGKSARRDSNKHS